MGDEACDIGDIDADDGEDGGVGDFFGRMFLFFYTAVFIFLLFVILSKSILITVF